MNKQVRKTKKKKTRKQKKKKKSKEKKMREKTNRKEKTTIMKTTMKKTVMTTMKTINKVVLMEILLQWNQIVKKMMNRTFIRPFFLLHKVEGYEVTASSYFYSIVLFIS